MVMRREREIERRSSVVSCVTLVYFAVLVFLINGQLCGGTVHLYSFHVSIIITLTKAEYKFLPKDKVVILKMQYYEGHFSKKC